MTFLENWCGRVWTVGPGFSSPGVHTCYFLVCLSDYSTRVQVFISAITLALGAVLPSRVHSTLVPGYEFHFIACRSGYRPNECNVVYSNGLTVSPSFLRWTGGSVSLWRRDGVCGGCLLPTPGCQLGSWGTGRRGEHWVPLPWLAVPWKGWEMCEDPLCWQRWLTSDLLKLL